MYLHIKTWISRITIYMIHAYTYATPCLSSIQKYNINTPVTGVSSPMVDFPVMIGQLLCAICWRLSTFDGWVMAAWLGLLWWVANMYLSGQGSRFKVGIQHIEQLTHNWHLPCCQCTGTSSCLLYTKIMPYGGDNINQNTSITKCNIKIYQWKII